MIRWVIVDAGPLTAFLDADDSWHGWAVERFRKIQGPLLTVEPVLTKVLWKWNRDKVLEEIRQRVREGLQGSAKRGDFMSVKEPIGDFAPLHMATQPVNNSTLLGLEIKAELQSNGFPHEPVGAGSKP